MCSLPPIIIYLLFFFNDTATTEIYTLSLHDALPISPRSCCAARRPGKRRPRSNHHRAGRSRDRKSTRLNSSHANISYAVFCLKKKKMTRLDRQAQNEFTSDLKRQILDTN